MARVYLTSDYKDSLANLANALNVEPKCLQDPKIILPLLTPIVYFAEQVVYGLISKIPWMYKLPLIGLMFDNKSMFIGTYLSLPADQDELNIFTIKFDSLSERYELNGYAYSLSRNGAVGDWESQKLDMNTTEPVTLSYIYEGERYSEPKVRGLVYIKFDSEKPEKSHSGYWVDTNHVGKADWNRSNYVKVTPGIKKKIIANAFFMDKDFPFLHIRRFINKPRSPLRLIMDEKTYLLVTMNSNDRRCSRASFGSPSNCQWEIDKSA